MLRTLAPLLALALAGALAAPAAARTVRIATEGAYPPWNFVNERGEVDGFERELGDALCARAGLSCTWVVQEWESLIPNLVAGNADAIIGSLVITPARAAVIAFSEPYLPPDPVRFFAPAGAGPEAMVGVVATQANTIFADHLATTPAVVAAFSTAEEVVAAVRAGVADAGLLDQGFLDPILAESDGALVYLGAPLILSPGTGVGLRQSDAELRAAFDAAIAAMKADGSLNAMIRRWFGPDFPIFD
jgi:polar amino acid transport system substrate-binding protein